VVAEHIAVIAGKNDQRVVVPAAFFEETEHPAEFVVEKFQGRMVSAPHRPEIGGGKAADIPHIPRTGFAGVSRERFVSRRNRVGNPALFHRVVILARPAIVGVVRVEHAQAGEPGLPGRSRFDEFTGFLRRPAGEMQRGGDVFQFTPLPHQGFAESGVFRRQPAAVAVERALHVKRRFIAPLVDVEPIVRMALLRLFVQAGDVQFAEEPGVVSAATEKFREERLPFGKIVVEPGNAVRRHILPGPQRSARRGAHRARTDAGFEQRPLGCQPVEIRRVDHPAAGAGKGVEPLLVGQNQ